MHSEDQTLVKTGLSVKGIAVCFSPFYRDVATRACLGRTRALTVDLSCRIAWSPEGRVRRSPIVQRHRPGGDAADATAPLKTA